MRLSLRNYQSRTLDALQRFFEDTTTLGASVAFMKQTERPYRTVPKLSELPYVCLRVPTGGGKTIMAAHAVGIAAQHLVRRDNVVCLWLVPSDAIREQTLKHLRTLGDPYRDALEAHFSGPVSVIDLAEALGMHRAVPDGETVVIVSTLAALRVTDTQGRKVYEQDGALQDHFANVAPELQIKLERANGVVIPSLANALALRRPIVIMDEAHNARTPLSFDTIERFAPSCVIEFTATPDTRHAPASGHFASNVLAHVSAAELKAEEMIKLPVQLHTRPAWTDAVSDAIACQRALELVANDEARGVYGGESTVRIRPMVLFQAQPNRRDGAPITVEVLRGSLIDDHRIPEDQIAIATGDQRDLDGVDLSDPANRIRFVITVQALREGWDCPNAYILCSIAEQTGPRAVEQILGRILRMPGAKRRAAPALNESYAFVVSQGFAQAAAGLKDALIANGFERYEAESVVLEATSALPLFQARADAPIRLTVSELPSASAIPAPLAGIVRFDVAARIVTVTAPLDDSAGAALEELFPTVEGKAEARRIVRASRGELYAMDGATVTPAHPPLVIPQLAIVRDGHPELFEDTHFMDVPWTVAGLDACIAYPPGSDVTGMVGTVDVTDQGRLTMSFADEVDEQLALLQGEPGWTLEALVIWIDRHIAHPDLTQRDVTSFILAALSGLIDSGIPLDRLARDKYRLRKLLEARMEEHRLAQRKRAFQQELFDGSSCRMEVVPEVALVLDDESRYAPNWIYEGAYRFRKHLFAKVGELGAEGAEFDCAAYLDEHASVECWVRNLAGRSRDSFWLQTSSDRYYPDFVGRLTDGRVFAVECKGGHLWSADDATEKRRVGALWQELSGGRCIHVMPRDRNWTEISTAFVLQLV